MAVFKRFPGLRLLLSLSLVRTKHAADDLEEGPGDNDDTWEELGVGGMRKTERAKERKKERGPM